jgi:predicted Zn-dependent peptidase
MLRFGWLALIFISANCMAIGNTAPPTVAPIGLNVPIEYYRLNNGLRVVLAHDASIPTVTVGTYYHIGFRLEPPGRTGFAHLFEHLMFQETPNLRKGEADQAIAGNGGLGNGSTRFDYTNYFEVVPSNTLETALFVEADRMRGLVVSGPSIQNQKDVVKNEVRVNVLNRPYGGFPWLDLPQAAYVNWHNAHNFYGELDEIDAATLADVRSFYETYYVPSNAVLIVAGAFDPSKIRSMVEKHFGELTARDAPPRPDIREGAQDSPRERIRTDPLAPRPALAVGYPLPERNTDEWFAFNLLDVILLQGEESRLWQRLVTEKGISDSVDGGINLLGSPYDYEGPMLWSASLVHDNSISDIQVLREMDAVLDELQSRPIGQEEMQRARTKVRSALYDIAGSPTRFGLIEILACGALFDDDPSAVNRIESRLGAVSPEQVRDVARKYLQASRRTVVHLRSGAEASQP